MRALAASFLGWVLRPEGVDWDAFWKDLSVSGMSLDEERKRVVGVLIGGDTVGREDALDYARRGLRRHVLMRALMRGRPPSPAALQKEAAELEETIRRELAAKYG